VDPFRTQKKEKSRAKLGRLTRLAGLPGQAKTNWRLNPVDAPLFRGPVQKAASGMRSGQPSVFFLLLAPQGQPNGPNGDKANAGNRSEDER
jgi:hypothetical protein